MSTLDTSFYFIPFPVSLSSPTPIQPHSSTIHTTTIYAPYQIDKFLVIGSSDKNFI